MTTDPDPRLIKTGLRGKCARRLLRWAPLPEGAISLGLSLRIRSESRRVVSSRSALYRQPRLALPFGGRLRCGLSGGCLPPAPVDAFRAAGARSRAQAAAALLWEGAIGLAGGGPRSARQAKRFGCSPGRGFEVAEVGGLEVSAVEGFESQAGRWPRAPVCGLPVGCGRRRLSEVRPQGFVRPRRASKKPVPKERQRLRCGGGSGVRKVGAPE
jgi:hypothetical protein